MIRIYAVTCDLALVVIKWELFLFYLAIVLIVVVVFVVVVVVLDIVKVSPDPCSNCYSRIPNLLLHLFLD